MIIKDNTDLDKIKKLSFDQIMDLLESGNVSDKMQLSVIKVASVKLTTSPQKQEAIMRSQEAVNHDYIKGYLAKYGFCR